MRDGGEVAKRLTTAQAIVQFLECQYVSRDGEEHRFFEGCFGIFGHGNIAGMGQALEQTRSFPYYLARNEQAMVHAATAFAKMSNRLRTLACTTSIGPGATNMITGAAVATVNRLPVLLLPGDIFAGRNAVPVLQQIESSSTQDVSVNDCFRPVARYWDRIQRPEQIFAAMTEAMRVLTSPADTGAVVISLPQDVQAEAFYCPDEFLRKRVWFIPRQRCDRELLQKAATWIRQSTKPLIVAGGGVIFSAATETLADFASQFKIRVVETQAGKGSLPFDHPQALGAAGVTGTPGAILSAEEADLVLGIGTRYSDFTTASRTAFQNPDLRFININVAELDAFKHSALPLVGDARVVLEELRQALGSYQTESAYQATTTRLRAAWEQEVDRIYHLQHGPPISQGEVIGAVNDLSGPKDVVLCAAGSLPGDLHKLWRTRDPKGYHLEYGFSCMGYEIAGGLGVKMAAPDREVYVMVGDASYLMLAQEITTSVQEGYKLNIILIDNHGFSSIGALSRSCGNEGMGTEYRHRKEGSLSGAVVSVDFVANAISLGAHACKVSTREQLREAIQAMQQHNRTSVVVVETDYGQHVPGYGAWWDVPIAEVSEMKSVQSAYEKYAQAKQNERHFL
jgi:3D-(3,5/4)-trihydroxycyclohexane-1,2-dione acylhydrolase (decyclizing)